jgi:hypothetical protein
VGAAQLRDRVIAILVENFCVQLLGALDPRRGACGGSVGVADFVGELVQEQPAQRFRRAGVAREKRPFDRLGKVGQRENMTVEVGEVRRQARALVGTEFFGGHRSGRDSTGFFSR